MQFPNHRRTTTRAFIAGAAVAALCLSGAVGATAATTDPSPGPLEVANAQLSKEAATQGMVLLENLNGALPMASSGNVALFGVGAYATVKGGTGSGAVNNRYTISVRDGFEAAGYTVTTSDAYWEAMSTTRVEQALTAESVAPTAPTDTAIFVVARNSGEGSDRSSGAGDYLLTDVERADLALIGQTYDNVVVVLNVGGIVDTSFFDEINAANTDPNGGKALDALFLMIQPGQEAGNALVEVLNGTVNPSGKLTDTWAASYDLYPASATFANADGNVVTEEYSEGIYVGYRYFDSFAKQIAPDDPQGGVLYPFGYGLSYTDFEVKTLNVSADMSDVTVRVKVTNTGTEYSGGEVVQVYFSAPQTGLDKPYQELAGYAKTAELAPGASQILTITFPTTEMSSYDAAQAAYVMDAGEYLIRVGDSSRNTKVAARVQLGDTVVTEQVSNELTDQSPATVLVSSPELFYGYGSEAAEIRSAQRVPLHTKGFVATNHASALEQDVPVASDSPYYPFDGDLMSSVTAYVDPAVTDWEGTGEPYQAKLGETLSEVQTDPATTLYDVAAGQASLEQFVAGLSVTQLANIVEGTAAAGSTLTARGAAGYTTPLYENLGVPGMTLSDGPAGVRITQQWTTLPAIDTQYLTPPSGTGQGLQGNYYANTTLSGTPAATQTDPQVAFTWNGPPTPGVPGTNFSAKWTGTLTPPVTGTYTFGLTSDDGSRLVINGQQVIDNWRDQAPNTKTAQVALTAGQPVQIEVDYYQGGGGAMVNLGWVLPGSDLIIQAAALAAKSDVAVVYANLFESEGSDLANIDLPGDQNQLIEAVAAANPNTIVVLNTGSAVTMPWLDKVKGVLEAWYPGQQSGNAIAALLFGDVNPSGKLPVTFPKSLDQVPASTAAQWPGVNGKVQYSEGLDVGYRWYDAKNLTPLFPFGYGLSYTSFRFSKLHVDGQKLRENGRIHASVHVTNTGRREGAEVAQLYLSDPASTGEPANQLKGFQKVDLKPGQTKHMRFEISAKDASYWNSDAQAWTLGAGTYTVHVGDSSRNLPLSDTFRVDRTTGPRDTKVTAPAVAIPGSTLSVTTTFTNGATEPVRGAATTLAVPAGWTATAQTPASFELVAPGQTTSTSWSVTVPENAPGGVLTLTATTRYRGSDRLPPGTGSTTVNVAFANLAAAYNTVGVSDDADPAAGNLDGSGYSFSAQALASVGVTPGGTVTSGSTSFTWPDVPAGQPDTVTTA